MSAPHKGKKKRPCANIYKHASHLWTFRGEEIQCPGVGRGAH